MSRIELAAETAEDLDRILEQLLQHEVADAPARIAEITEGISVLAPIP